MKLASLITAFASLAMVSSASAAGGFEFTLDPDVPGDRFAISDDVVGVFALEMGGGLLTFATIELEINGLTHANPWDLDILLIDPMGVSMDILKDHGDQNSVTTVNLTFNDNGAPLPANVDDSLAGSPYSLGAVLPQGTIRIGNVLQTGNGFGDAFDGISHGLNTWILIVSDDTLNGQEGSFDSFTLRGTYVPEPMSLSLLAAGALAVFTRRKR